MRRSLALLLTALAVGAAFGPCGPGGPRRPNALSRAPQRRLRLCQEEPPKLDDKDWRAFRAKLVAAQQAGEGGDGGASTTPEGGFMYATPLIEQGSVILGGTDQEFGFALRQQYFHKSVMLLLQHDEGFTKGIILNRPSAYEIDGWRVWFGGDVAEGAMFRGEAEAKGEREIICLHAIESEQAERLSMPVIKGVSCAHAPSSLCLAAPRRCPLPISRRVLACSCVADTTLEGARALVSSGEAQQSDFWVFVGYAGWAPAQLQGEVERDSWFLASADSGTLLQELLRQGTELPPPSSGIVPGNGLATWEKLMISIGRKEFVERTRGNLPDQMLSEWCRVRLIPPAATVVEPPEVSDARTRDIAVGTVIRGGKPADRFLLSDQFLHKSIVLLVHELPEGGYVRAAPSAAIARRDRLRTASPRVDASARASCFDPPLRRGTLPCAPTRSAPCSTDRQQI